MLTVMGPLLASKTYRFLKVITSLLCFLLLSACSIFEPIKIPPMHYFTLALPDPKPKRPHEYPSHSHIHFWFCQYAWE